MRNFVFILLSSVLHLTSSCKGENVRLVLLPDTQYYAEWGTDDGNYFYAQARWIVGNADSIDFVLHLGDITGSNSDIQWSNMLKGFEMLDSNNIPYTFVAGNHDIDVGGSARTRQTDNMNKYMPYSKYSNLKSFAGAFQEGEMDNTCWTFEAAGCKFMIFSLEFGPRNKVLEWMNKTIAQYPNHNIIVNTHGYLNYDDARLGAREGQHYLPSAYGLSKDASGTSYPEDSPEFANNGEQMWLKSISLHPNMLMVVCGHILGDGAGRLVSEGRSGNKVYQMLSNYQAPIDAELLPNGANSHLRIVDMDIHGKTIKVRSYCPHTGNYRDDPQHAFTFENVEFSY